MNSLVPNSKGDFEEIIPIPVCTHRVYSLYMVLPPTEQGIKGTSSLNV